MFLVETSKIVFFVRLLSYQYIAYNYSLKILPRKWNDRVDAKKAVALISGGLDSLLAVRVMQQQGIYVEGINFYTGFCVEGHTHAIRKKDQKKPVKIIVY